MTINRQTDNSDSSKISFGHVNITSSRSPSPGRRSQSPRRQLSAGANKGKMGLSLFMNNLAHTASPKAQSNNGSIASGSRSNSQRNLNCIQTCVSVIGARKSGKTSLCRRFTQGTFEELYEPTFTFETYNRTITLGAGKAATSVDVKVLDTAVESVPLKESRPFLEMADGIMLVYSITSVESAQALEGLLDIIYAWSGIGDRSALPILVVATQSDGIAGKPFKHSETTRKALKIGQQFAELNELPHLETTALSPRATEVFSHLIRLTLTRR
ncbi:hypothetical protein SARC_12438 [Sphaeroforma arctica JP610]|uniref:Uncharacterized protein n=1 Tax=Sphaeroforma arctica JP610 TaxID=667725 RepID=A0A0L0FE42_9EUKA|nr:hypothetical protein SARC_12438 [Sphaeroforma arctica JP610]KNC75029.1 hypothetical protein SARC_12438 [Sphaeroforma arctica JP610]|eukprot:XP_014148931.1 hypothetical protein SARC_12438 [Sphaeroforma arctica JP610]